MEDWAQVLLISAKKPRFRYPEPLRGLPFYRFSASYPRFFAGVRIRLVYGRVSGCIERVMRTRRRAWGRKGLIDSVPGTPAASTECAARAAAATGEGQFKVFQDRSALSNISF